METWKLRDVKWLAKVTQERSRFGVPIQVYLTPELVSRTICLEAVLLLPVPAAYLLFFPCTLTKEVERENATTGPIMDGFSPSQEEGNESPSNKKWMVVPPTHPTVGSAWCFLSFLTPYNLRVEIKASCLLFGFAFWFSRLFWLWHCIKFKQWKRQGPIGEDCVSLGSNTSPLRLSPLFFWSQTQWGYPPLS